MKKQVALLLFVLALVGTVLVTSHHLVVSEALAADVASSVLASTDAGATNIATFQFKQTYKIQCDIPACYRVGTAAAPPAPNCATDAVIPGGFAVVPAPLPYTLESAGATKIAAYALDAGNPNCRVYFVSKNPGT